MTTRFRIEIRADYRASTGPVTKSAPVLCVAAGKSQVDWQSEKARAIGDLKNLVGEMSKSGGMTLLMESHYAAMLFPNHRAIDFISMVFKEWGATGDGVLLTTTCKDLKVSGVLALNAHLVELAKAKGITLDVDVGKSQAVTLLSDQKFTVS